ncbi:MAG: 16S/23S rRNA (cytidine-2'-O)-methyltransferase, partial [Candidatus Eremiobacteraeota bacterium]|nr:16S/23S rRNA (cytidine-2'-O)-methyltransferase [Candidatus Eremiobacteraeota bacterium]
ALPIASLGLVAIRLCASGLRGPSGNVEFFALVRRSGPPFDDAEIERVLGSVPV